VRGTHSLLIIFLILFSFQAFAEDKKNQLEELFIWKTSDELKLSASEEKKFTDLVKFLNKRKSDLNQSLHDSVDRIAAAKTTKDKDAELTKYRKDLGAYNKISEEEFDKMKTLLGSERLAQYLKLKQDLTGRIKTMLANPEGSKAPDKKLPAPKVIIE
jgi:hypothetical protein